jgi:hypothetical protein
MRCGVVCFCPHTCIIFEKSDIRLLLMDGDNLKKIMPPKTCDKIKSQVFDLQRDLCYRTVIANLSGTNSDYG